MQRDLGGLRGGAGAPSTQTTTVYVESLFFPTLSADSLNPMTIWALLKPPGSVGCAGAPTAA